MNYIKNKTKLYIEIDGKLYRLVNSEEYAEMNNRAVRTLKTWRKYNQDGKYIKIVDLFFYLIDENS